MMRVCGITFDHTTNYGSCLQSYALGAAIERLTVGGEPVSYSLIPLRAFWDYPRGLIRHFVGWTVTYMNRMAFLGFEKKNIRWAKCKRLSELPAVNERYDAFVCGSDVIWNPDFSKGIGAYFLDFAKKYKFSYAASFGKAEIPDEAMKPFADSLDALREIGLREPAGEGIVRRYSNAPVHVVTDPVLLLTRADWDRVAANGGKKGGYIFSYTTRYSSELAQVTQTLQDETGLPVVRAVWNASPRGMLRQGRLLEQSPARFLQQLRDADYVITNSFHATAFSVIYHKRFFTVVHGGKQSGTNIRMAEFLTSLGLEERLLNGKTDPIDLSDVSYDAVDEKLEAMRAESLRFLQRNLEAAYREKKENEQKETLTDG